MQDSVSIPKIVIVGGGAGGLELATTLGHKLGKNHQAQITLIDPNRVHLWKPLLHEVVAGSLDTGMEALSYRAHSSENHYYFRLGAMDGLDKTHKQISLAPLFDHHGKQILKPRKIDYDILVIALGAKCNDFGIEGVHENCFKLDNKEEAEDFHLSFLNRFLQFSETAHDGENVSIAIVGAGATGVELSAELYNAVDRLEQFGVDKIHHQSLQVTLIEAAPRILPALDEGIATKAGKTLTDLGVNICVNRNVKGVSSYTLHTSESDIHADLLVWAAGIKAPAFLSELQLITNRIHQIEVEETLHAIGEDAIYAIGDCAFLKPDHAERPVPPTAQAAHQMAAFCAKNIIRQLKKQPPKKFRYCDHGALVSLGRFQTFGSLLDQLFHKHWLIEGGLAHWAYASLYRQHQLALHGYWKTFWIIVSSLIEKRIKPKLKLY
ncbi:NAD(P)/FAD-dependent oxidoreductase [Hydrogenovibrio kuenenii]|uniref:NAD(P)/FAD-dependent oxidoreductase n=1 Tax=Hydrogenovibrio kuenenii TaxID=63658 RepID=UPI0004674A53|nr:NAD(P)/FAD-dependent oxidoreductase [Hydrogenovibrio kuenenii]